MINKRALNVFSYSTLESLHYLRIWSVITLVCCTGDFETEQVLLEYRGSLVSFRVVGILECTVRHFPERPFWWNLSVYERDWRCV